MGVKLTEKETHRIVKGAEERDLAHSGLEDTMISSFNQASTSAAHPSLQDHVMALGALLSPSRSLPEQILRQQEVLSKSDSKPSLRIAAMVLAINKVANVVKQKGKMLAG
jgi:hypothetical protein